MLPNKEWSSAHSLPSVSLSDAASQKTLVRKEETESEDVPSSHSTPMHNYSKDEDRRHLVLNSCLKTSRSHGTKPKKSHIKFDATAAGHQGRSGLRRRKFSKKKVEDVNVSDSSPEGSPSKKAGGNRGLLATLGLLRSEDAPEKMSKRKKKAKKKSETMEKLLQSKKTFAIDEPCEASERRFIPKEKTIDENVQETKNIINMLNKLSLEEKKNSQLSKLMAHEFKSKRPPLIFGGTYPIDEPFESRPVVRRARGAFMESIRDGTRANVNVRRQRYVKPTPSINQVKTSISSDKSDLKNMQTPEGELTSKLTPLDILKNIHHSGKKFLQQKEDISTSSKSTKSNSNAIECEKECDVSIFFTINVIVLCRIIVIEH